MSLNIKNERVHDLAKTAAEMSGESQTSAVEAALVQYIAAMRAEQSAATHVVSREDRLAWRLQQFRDELARSDSSLDTDELYDEAGLPA